MKYVPMQTGMWAVFAGSFRKNLEAVFDLDPKTAGAVTAAAKKQYRRILRELPDFEKGDRFLMNIVSCAMLAAFILSMPERPNVERLREYYERSMMTPAMRVYCRKSGSRTYTQGYRDGMKFTAQFRAADRNPCSWNMDYFEYPDGSGFEARFTACAESSFILLPTRKKVPTAPYFSSTSSTRGVVTVFGPSSKVKAIILSCILSHPLYFISSRISPISSPKSFSASFIGAAVVISTPAPFSSEMGSFEQPPFRKPM